MQLFVQFTSWREQVGIYNSNKTNRLRLELSNKK